MSAHVRTIRILVVDDSAVARHFVGNVLDELPDVEYEAVKNGQEALDSIRKIRPDLVILDLEMPVMDGLTTLAEIRKDDTELPVIVFSSHTERGAAMTLRSLAAGADDYLAKPAELADSEAIRRELRDGIISRIDALVRRDVPVTTTELPSGTYRAIASKRGTSPIDLVVIGASTGGPDALGTVLQGLPADLPVPVLVVVHILPMFSRILAEQLDAKCSLSIREGTSGGLVEPGVAWLAPGAKHMFVEKGEGGLTVALSRSAPVHGCRPAVDVLFESVAKTTGAGVLGVILTGMGEDGCTGAAAIRAQGGQILAQDEATSVVYGMPRAVVEAGLADEVLPLQDIAGVIERRVRKTRVRI